MGRPKLDASEEAGRTKLRHVRVPDELWLGAAVKAEQDGETISAVVRELLRAYLRGDVTL
jgi:hypothetical protein